jgi:hypothetical protein
MRNIGIPLALALAVALPAQAKSSKAEVTCKDGTTSKAGRGACSHHGGVAATQPRKKSSGESAKAPTRADRESERATKSDEPGILDKLFGRRQADKAQDRSPADKAQGRSPRATPRSTSRDAKSGTPTARCKDGTTSYSAHHSGTCSGHGGVTEWLDR